MISVVIPVYNVEQYLDRCLYSVVNQTYKDIEIILVDDGSTDQSGKICDNWKSRDQRVIVVHTMNHGVSSARNQGLKLVKGEFISFIDADDWIDFDMYEKLLKNMIMNNAEVGICGYTIEPQHLKAGNLKREEERLFNREEAVLEIFKYENNKVPKILSWELCDKLFSRKIIQNVKFNEAIYNGEDMLFCWQALKNARRISYIPLHSYHYFTRVDSAVHLKRSIKSISVLKAVRYILNDSKNESKLIQSMIKDHYLRIGMRHSREVIRLHALQYKDEVLYFQKFLRSHIYHGLCLSYVSIKGKIGMLIFCLPYSLCTFLLK